MPPPFELRFETPPGQQAQVDFAQFQTEGFGEPQYEVAAGSGAAVLHEAQVAGGGVGPQRQFVLTERTVPAPPPQQVADGLLRLLGRRHALTAPCPLPAGWLVLQGTAPGRHHPKAFWSVTVSY